MKILYLSPTYFSGVSHVGGGERYAYELARAVANETETVFVSFSKAASDKKDGPLRVVLLKSFLSRGRYPVSLFYPAMAKWVRWADAIHCYHVKNAMTDTALVLGKIFGKKVYVTDLGGGDAFSLGNFLPLARLATGFPCISMFSRRILSETLKTGRVGESPVIYGGVDRWKFFPGRAARSKRALFVGRLMPHKGLEYLIDAIADPLSLDIVGHPYSEKYRTDLKRQAEGKDIRFYEDLKDEALVEKYRSALVTVQPSVYRTADGKRSRAPELLGLAVLESMACGTPVIASDIASFPELVREEETGFLVPPNDPEALRAKIGFLYRNPASADVMGEKARGDVLEKFTWEITAKRCLEIYQNGILCS